MSAVHDDALINAKVRKFNSKIKVLVHSHRLDEGVDITSSVFNFQSSKTIKGVGTANIACVSSVNWLNTLGPNDVVNVYFDIGDGRGYTRTFFGFIDRIEEQYSVSEKGEPQTLYYLICSDFSKAFAVTNIYSNPSLIGREDFIRLVPGLAHNRPGFSLFSSGLLAYGTPGDLIRNIITVTLGWGGQFRLPLSYRNSLDTNFVEENRSGRIESADRTFFSADNSSERFGGGGLRSFVDEQTSRADNTATAILGGLGQGSLNQDTVSLLESVGIKGDSESVGGLVEELGEVEFRQVLRTAFVANSLNDSEQARRAGSVISSAVPGSPITVLDVIDLQNFIEREALDGYCSRIPTADFMGSVEKLVRSFVNELVNELFFDLRPVIAGDDPIGDGTNWSVDPDEVGGNEGSTNGIRYVPAVVLREFPFSTINELDGSDVEMSLKSNDGSGNLNYGFFYFGAVFSDRAEVPGRHKIKAPNINVVDRAQGVAGQTSRILDVAVISPEEITSTKFGRSDTDVVNLIQLHAASSAGNSSKYILKDLVPVFTPIQFFRHGLRVRELTTRFALLPAERITEASTESASVNSPASSTGSSEPTETNTSDPTALIINGNAYHPPNVTVRNYLNDDVPGDSPEDWNVGNTRARTEVNSFVIHETGGGTVISQLVRTLKRGNLSVQLALDGDGTFTQFGDLKTFYGYHAGVHNRASIGCEVLGPYNKDPRDPWNRVIPEARWVPKDSNDSKDYVVPTEAQAEALFLLIDWLIETRPEGIAIPDRWIAYQQAGRFELSQVEGADSPNPGVMSHCNSHWVDDNGRTRVHADGAWLALYCFLRKHAGMDPSTAYEQAIDRAQSTNRRYATLAGLSITTTPARLGTDNATTTQEADSEHEGGTATTSNPNQRVTNEVRRSQATVRDRSGRVDTDSTRKMISRWALLQDHWYQHNAEYLSGQVDMRGAPEIRVGYRLDILKRNLSFYVEGVRHSWKVNDRLKTSLTVTRGQPNKPYHSYTLPTTPGFARDENQRSTENSRLGEYFIVQDLNAQAVGRVYGGRHLMTLPNAQNTSRVNPYSPYQSVSTNVVDTEDYLEAKEEAYVLASSSNTARVEEKSLDTTEPAEYTDDSNAVLEALKVYGDGGESGDPAEGVDFTTLQNTGFGAGVPGADENT